MLKIYDTKLREKVPFESLEHGKIGMYVCGPTVYNYIHIGNARTFVSFDVIRRYLSWRGFDVKFVSNITDVDDKIIKKANEEGRSAAEVAAEYSQAFLDDMHAMNVQDPDVRPRATEEIPEMIQLIQELIDGGHAYEVEGDVYFSVRSYADYGALSGRNIDEMEGGHRELRADGQGLEDRKRDHLDFALWKAAKPGEPSWESPWGQGRPGWHIECSAMSRKYLGLPFDIHGGGADLVFPHHENERAQSEAACGCTFANHWMHSGMLQINHEKMSKSLGNFLLLRDILKTTSPDVLRFLMLQTHYRSPLDFSDERLDEAASALSRIENAVRNLDWQMKNAQDVSSPLDTQAILKQAKSTRVEFVLAMDDRPGWFREHPDRRQNAFGLRCSRRARSARDYHHAHARVRCRGRSPGLGGRTGRRISGRGRRLGETGCRLRRLRCARGRGRSARCTCHRACREELGSGRCRA